MIHPSAVISKKAKLATDVQIGPATVVEDEAEIGAGTKIGPFCTITGNTFIGKNNRIFSGAVIGSIPQDLKYRGEKTRLIIGNSNTIREYVTINPGTGEDGKTVIGDNNLLMAYVHIAHDCIVKNDVIIANVGTLAGHITVEDRAIIGGLAAIHQFVRVGRLAIVGGCSKVVQDIPPYSTCDGHPARVIGINREGLKRAKFSLRQMQILRRAFRILFFSRHPFSVALEIVEKEIPACEETEVLVEFMKNTKRGVCR